MSLQVVGGFNGADRARPLQLNAEPFELDVQHLLVERSIVRDHNDGTFDVFLNRTGNRLERWLISQQRVGDAGDLSYDRWQCLDATRLDQVIEFADALTGG